MNCVRKWGNVCSIQAKNSQVFSIDALAQSLNHGSLVWSVRILEGDSVNETVAF